ncbi:MAG: hypothetical protein M3Y33_04835 [Actinomycetota bacterium]|nr:hypothetical protein [Actinomycetota bacterium]
MDTRAVSSAAATATIRLFVEDVGRTAAENRLSAISGEPARGVQIVPSALVERESTGPQPPGHQPAGG